MTHTQKKNHTCMMCYEVPDEDENRLVKNSKYQLKDRNKQAKSVER